MRHTRPGWSTALLVIASACSATSDRGDGGTAGNGAQAGSGSAGTGGGSSGSGGSAGTGSGGHSGSGGGGASCEALESSSSEVISQVVRTLDLSCESDDECEYVSNSTHCHGACGVLVGPVGKQQLEAAVESENSGRCMDFEAMGCVALVPPCVPPPPGIRCGAGRCTSDDEGPAGGTGGGSPDAGMPVGGCLDRALTFGWNGGFVAFSDLITISPCRTFVIERQGAGDPGADAMCQNAIASDAAIDVDAVDAALAEPEVQAAFAAAPELFGVDSRPVDGSVYRIELNGAAIEVGGPCGGGGGLGGPCTEIPPAVDALVTLLQDLVEQQRMLPDCDQLP